MRETYLYIKQHTVTGKLYFGKTTKHNPNKYIGSGKYWQKHIKKHGKEHVITKWISEPFTVKEELVEFALAFSELYNIVESQEWANLIQENGLDGAPLGAMHSEESKKKMAAAVRVGRKHTEESKKKMSASQRGRILSESHKEKIREIVKNRPQAVKDKIANTLRGKKHSEETIKKRAASCSKPRGAYGPSEHCKTRPLRTCPHCQTVGKGGSMSRYHFDNCKHMNKG